MFQDDLYPLTVSPEPALSAEEWFSGINKDPCMMDLKTRFQIVEKVRILLEFFNFKLNHFFL